MENQEDVLDHLIEEKIQALGKELSPEEKAAFRADVINRIQNFQKAGVDQDDAEEFTKFNIGLGLPGAMVLLESLLKVAGYTDKRMKHLLKNVETPHDIEGGTSLEVTYQKDGKDKKIHMRVAKVAADHDNSQEWEEIAQNVTVAELERLRQNEGMILRFVSSVMGHLVRLNKDLFDDLKNRLPKGVQIDALHLDRDNTTLFYKNGDQTLEPRVAVILA